MRKVGQSCILSYSDGSAEKSSRGKEYKRPRLNQNAFPSYCEIWKLFVMIFDIIKSTLRKIGIHISIDAHCREPSQIVNIILISCPSHQIALHNSPLAAD